MKGRHLSRVGHDSNPRQVHSICVPTTSDRKLFRNLAVIVLADRLQQLVKSRLFKFEKIAMERPDQFCRANTVIWVMAFQPPFDIMKYGKQPHDCLIGPVESAEPSTVSFDHSPMIGTMQ